MTEKPAETARSIHDRVHAEMLDSFDEELELEIDDDRLDALTNEFSGHTASETVDRRFYFKELFRLQGELVKLQEEGKIRHIGLSEINVDQLHAAQKITQIVSVQNLYNLTNRSAEALLDEATTQGIGFIPWFPLAAGPLAAPDGPLAKLGAEHGNATPSQLALAWLLKRSPVVLPIPGTSSVAHLEENVAAAEIELSDDEFDKLSELGKQNA